MSRPRLATREQLRDVLILPRLVLILITRDMSEVISKICYEHEIDVLAEVFGEQNIQRIEDPLEHNVLIASIDVVEKARAEMNDAAKRRRKVTMFYAHPETPCRWEPVDPDRPEAGGQWVDEPVTVGEEMARLRTAYGMHHEKAEFFVDVAYPHERDFIEACGGEYQPKKAQKDAA